MATRCCARSTTPRWRCCARTTGSSSSAFEKPLLEHYERHTHGVQPKSAYNEVVSFIRSGLSDISMSRSSVDWGIPLPWDEDQVVYVWFDAPLNYITAIGYGAREGTRRPIGSRTPGLPTSTWSARTS